MARTETWFDQDLKKPVSVRIMAGVQFSEDNQGSLIGVRVYDDGAEATLTGGATGYCILADGQTITVDGTREENTAYILLPQSALLVPGPIQITIKLVDDGVITTLLACVGTVIRTKIGVPVVPGSVIEEWSEQISETLQDCVDDCQAAADAMGANLATTYSTSATYPVGSYVIQSGTLYRCTTAVTTAGSWSSNSSKFAAVKMGNDVADLKSAITNIDDAIEHDNETVLLRKTINASNEVTDSTTRLITPVFMPRAGQSFSVQHGYEFRFALITSATTVTFYSSWVNSYVITDYNVATATLGMRFQIRNANNTSGSILPSEIKYETDIPDLLIYKKTVTKEYVDDYDNFVSVYDYIRRFGLEPNEVTLSAGSSGATVDQTTKIITVPSGSTGFNAYFAIGFSRSDIKNYTYSDKEAVFTVALKCSTDPDNLALLMWYATRDTSYSKAKKIGMVDADTYLYEVRFPFASTLDNSGKEFIYIQIKNSTLLADSATLQYISSCIEWDAYCQKFIDNMRLISGENILFTIDKTSETVDGQTDNNLFRGLVYCYNNGIKNIVVKPGTYDLIAEMHEIYGDDWETDITGDDLLKKGIPLSNMDIVFEQGAKVTCNYTGSNSSFITDFSPFDLSSGTDVTVTGLNLVCGNVRYGIHDDVSYKTTPCIHVFRECYVRKSDNNNVWEQPYCLAGGLGSHSRHILTDCDFACEHTTGGNYNVLYYHNNAALTGSDGYIRIENMYCSGTFGSVYSGGQVQSVGDPAVMYVHGCRFTKAPTQGNANAIVMKAWGNTIESE